MCLSWPWTRGSVCVVQRLNICFRVPLGCSSMKLKVLATVMSSHIHTGLVCFQKGRGPPLTYLVSRGVCSSLAEEPSFSFLTQLPLRNPTSLASGVRVSVAEGVWVCAMAQRRAGSWGLSAEVISPAFEKSSLQSLPVNSSRRQMAFSPSSEPVWELKKNGCLQLVRKKGLSQR